jgi:release factor glutamine methyltransferase
MQPVLAGSDRTTQPPRRAAVPNAATLSGVLVGHGVRVLVLRGGTTVENSSRGNEERSIQFLISPKQVRAAVRAVEPLSWRYSWVRSGFLRLLPMKYFWWDGGFEFELFWGCPAAPMPSASLSALAKALWDGAMPGADGLMRPDPAALITYFAVQACRPPPGHERDWESFVALRAGMRDLERADAIATRVGVSRALVRALRAADAGSGPPEPGPLFDGPASVGWRLATAIQSHARPRRLRRLLAGMPTLGDATIRCRVAGVEVRAGPGVFVPTPDADIFVEMALSHLGSRPKPVVLELGTGCGGIALALARSRPDAEVHGTDLSSAAIRWAKRSARRLGLDHVDFRAGPLLEPVPAALRGRVDVIVANLPFYPARDYASIGSVPRDTIEGEDEDGLGLLRQLARGAPAFLRPGGTMILQMFSGQWPALSAELTDLGFRPGRPQITGPFAICPAMLIGPAERRRASV